MPNPTLLNMCTLSIWEQNTKYLYHLCSKICLHMPEPHMKPFWKLHVKGFQTYPSAVTKTLVWNTTIYTSTQKPSTLTYFIIFSHRRTQSPVSFPPISSYCYYYFPLTLHQFLIFVSILKPILPAFLTESLPEIRRAKLGLIITLDFY